MRGLDEQLECGGDMQLTGFPCASRSPPAFEGRREAHRAVTQDPRKRLHQARSRVGRAHAAAAARRTRLLPAALRKEAGVGSLVISPSRILTVSGQRGLAELGRDRGEIGRGRGGVRRGAGR